MTFEIEINAKDLIIDDRLGKYIDKKIPKLGRYIKDIVWVRVELSHIKSARNANDRNVAQITLKGKNYLLRSEERTVDIFSAFDAAMEKLQRKIERYKGKHYKGGGDRSSIREASYENGEDDFEGEINPNEIVRRKKFTIKPMNELEAIEQMNLLGHEEFFLFYNHETSSFNLLYRRRDGRYGIIETEIG